MHLPFAVLCACAVSAVICIQAAPAAGSTHSFKYEPKAMHNGPRGFEDEFFLTSIDAIKRDGRDDAPVLLRGRLTRFYGDENYEFTDINGDTIEVELDDDDYWSDIYKDQLIDILGKLDVDFFNIVVKVKKAAPIEPPPGN